jgi:glyoxylase-like metal-dependent hydrolase (beta-lactamase superfamily II)
VKLTVFHAGKGDCLLLSAQDGTTILVDGGMRDAYKEHVAPAMGALRDSGGELDLLYVSHIDQDHISGVLELCKDELDWRVADYQRRTGNDQAPDPERPRPPKVKNLWHNAFHEQVSANAGEIEELLAAEAPVLEASARASLRREAPVYRELATSISEGIELSRRAGIEQLRIPLNRQFDGRLALVRDDQRPIRLGGFKLTVIGPFREDLDVLRADWNKWLTKRRRQHEDLKRRMRRESERLPTTDVESLHEPLRAAAGELGNRSDVTPPNLASLMLLAEADGRAVLLTGDGHADDIVKGLKKADRLDQQGRIHIDVLKVQHHGAVANLTPTFAREVTADAYVLCGDGEHGNPESRVVREIVDARLGSNGAPAAGPRRQFKLLFNSSSQSSPDRFRRHMRDLEKEVAKRAADSGGRLKFSFATGSSFNLTLSPLR